MSSWLTRLIDALLGTPKSDVLEPSTRVTPDPQQAAEIERRRAELTYQPENAFHRDTQVTR